MKKNLMYAPSISMHQFLFFVLQLSNMIQTQHITWRLRLQNLQSLLAVISQN